MQESTLMTLQLLLPFQVFAEKEGVSRIVAETHKGSFGILPHRLDCIAALAPGILTYETEEEGEVHVAVNEGVLIKKGLHIVVSTRNAIQGEDLALLHQTVEQEFLQLNEREQNTRAVLAKLESGLIHQFVAFQHE